MKRITADIDTKNKLIVGYFTLKALFKIKRIKTIVINKSPSGNYHLIVWTTFPYKKYETFKLREFIGDDKHRLSMDKIRTLGRDTLFYKKEDF